MHVSPRCIHARTESAACNMSHRHINLDSDYLSSVVDGQWRQDSYWRRDIGYCCIFRIVTRDAIGSEALHATLYIFTLSLKKS